MTNKFIISEREKSRISNLHTQKALLERGFENLNQSITEQVNYYKDAQGKIVKLEGPMSAPLGTEPATEQEYLAQNPTITVTPPQGQPSTTATTRYSTAVCPGKDTRRGGKCVDKVLKIQVRMNDECPSDTLTVKLKEDGVIGPKTNTAFAACKPKLKPTKVAGGGGSTTGSTTQGTTASQGPKIGEPLTATDIATLTAQ